MHIMMHMNMTETMTRFVDAKMRLIDGGQTVRIPYGMTSSVVEAILATGRATVHRAVSNWNEGTWTWLRARAA